jgi:hypothetical protein
MMTRKLQTFCLMTILVLAMAPLQAFAVLKNSLNSVTVIPAEGNGVCKDYASNDFILEMGANISCPDTNPGTMESGTVYGPDGALADWDYDCASNELKFDVKEPTPDDESDDRVAINFSITKASRNITWYPYGAEPRFADNLITNQDPITGEVIPTASFALCYGLPTTNAVTTEPLPDCDSSGEAGQEINGWLGAINCAASGITDGTVVTLWQPLESGDRVFQCICNEGGKASSRPCSPEADTPDACYSKDFGQPKATTIIEFDSDPIACTTSGGDRTCKCVDNPFTPFVDECAL